MCAMGFPSVHLKYMCGNLPVRSLLEGNSEKTIPSPLRILL